MLCLAPFSFAFLSPASTLCFSFVSLIACASSVDQSTCILFRHFCFFLSCLRPALAAACALLLLLADCRWAAVRVWLRLSIVLA